MLRVIVATGYKLRDGACLVSHCRGGVGLENGHRPTWAGFQLRLASPVAGPASARQGLRLREQGEREHPPVEDVSAGEARPGRSHSKIRRSMGRSTWAGFELRLASPVAGPASARHLVASRASGGPTRRLESQFIPEKWPPLRGPFFWSQLQDSNLRPAEYETSGAYL